MNKQLTLSVLALSLSGLLLTSCKKEPGNDSPEASKVKSEIIFDEKGNVTYTYSGNKVTKVMVSGENIIYYTLEYNGNQIVKKNYFKGTSTVSSGYDKINYNTEGKISSVEHYTTSGTADTKEEITSFTYTNGKLSKLVLSHVTIGAPTLVRQMEYTYTNENVSSVKVTDAVSPNGPETFAFTYDNKNNYFKKLFSQSILIDPALELSNEGSIPKAFSANNPISMSTNGVVSPLPISYTLDNKSNLTLVKLNGQTAVQYNY